MRESRLPPGEGEIVDRRARLTFSYRGRRIEAFQGDTIGSALYAAGVRAFSRSFKYHRPRGLMCASGDCPNCLVGVDGVPNVRACVEPAADGTNVRPQNVFPSPEWDLLAGIQWFDRCLPVGFYYKAFYRPRWMWRAAERLFRRLGGLGTLRRDQPIASGGWHRERRPDVLIVGGGAAGLCAALEAARPGGDVMLVDEQDALGGYLRCDRHVHASADEHSGARGFEIARRLADAVEALPNVEVLRRATAFGRYEGGLVGVAQGRALIHVRPRALVVATGGHETPLLFGNHDLPGVFLAGGLRRLMNLYGVKPGRTAVVVAGRPEGLAVAAELLDASVGVAAVLLSERALNEWSRADVAKVRAAGARLLTSHAIREVRGRGRVQSAIVERRDAGPASQGEEIPCDLVCVSAGYRIAAELLRHAGARPASGDQAGAPDSLPATDGVYAAGDVTGIHDLRIAMLQGRCAGVRAASALHAGEAPECEPWQEQIARLEREYVPPDPGTLATCEPEGGKRIVCLCEDVTGADLTGAMTEGFDDIETLKRYSTASMGPCQGKMCLPATIAACAAFRGITPSQTGTTTARPPIRPVSLALLAGRKHHVTRLTPLHHLHVRAGAVFMDMGPWKRARTYTSADEEYGAVRERVGVIDISTLGKLEVRGRDAAALLDKVYTGVFSTLQPGRCRHAVMCDDGGVILDDGAVSRTDEDRYFVTTTSTNVDFVEGWLRRWAAGTGACVHVANVTSGFAALNVAGPAARSVLGGLADVDLSTTKFPHMACRQGTVAGVPALFLRLGFVGEIGWEIHFAAEYAEYVWETLFEAGRDAGMAPVGVDAQRTLRLEKQHLIVGHDTDSTSTPLETAMASEVRFEKHDFVGKAALTAIRARGVRSMLVGIELADARGADEGSPVVRDGRAVGRVTSLRYSPQLRRHVGLAWVPALLSHEGARVDVLSGDTALAARVARRPFYDPAGTRLKA